MLAHDLTVTRPDYAGGSIANLMATFGAALGAPPTTCPPLALLSTARVREARRVALVVIDGLGADLLAQIGADGELAARQAGTMTSVFPPTTATAVTTFMSGLPPQQHGLTGWFMHFRHLGAVTAVLPFVPRFSRSPLSASGIEAAALIDAPSFAGRIDARAAALLPAELAESDFSRLLAAGARRDGYRGLDDFVQRLAHFVDGGDDARFLYAYWPELDRLAHLHGPSSGAVAANYRELDRALAPVAAAAAASGTLLVVTADHGFIDSGPDERIAMADHPALAAMLSLPLCGEPRAAYAYVRAHAAGEFEDYVTRELGHALHLHRADEFLADGWYGPGAPHPELAARIGDYVLAARGRYSLADRVIGERGFDLRGQHGGLSAAEQRVPLLLAGV